MFKLLLFILLALCIHDSSCIVDDLYEAGKMVWDLYLVLDKIGLGNKTNTAKLEEIFTLGEIKNLEIENLMDEIFNKLDKIEEFMNTKNISDSLKLSSSAFILHTYVIGFQETIADIDYIYKEFEKYMKKEYENSAKELERLARRIIADIQGDITWIRKLVIGESVPQLNNINIIEAISVNAVRRYDEICNGPQLTASILAELFRMVVIAEIKTHLMLSLINIYQYGQKDGWNEINSFAKAEFKKNFASYVSIFSVNMNGANALYFRACDPENATWIRDRNFYELEKTIQTTIFPYNGEQCNPGICSDVWSTKSQECTPQNLDQRISCLHTITNCSDLGAIQACVLENGPYRFQYMKSTKLGTMRNNVECSIDNSYIFEYGNACACDCYGNDNKISLSIMKTRASLNWVIIGLRFFWQRGILYIQPKEGRLEANGHISPDDQTWLPIPEDVELQTIHRRNRVFFLDDLRLPSYHVLTGVKFFEQTRGNITGFAIEIFGTPFDYKSGKCFENESTLSVKGPNIITGSRIEFQKVPPIYAHVRYTPNPSAFDYVSLEKSELSADFGQSTLPFFDSVPILPSPPSVLGGIGMFHKGADGYSGFISLRVFGIIYKTYLSDFQREAIADGSVSFNSS